jgi:hypothetical protein
MAYKSIFVSTKVPTTIKFFALYPMGSLEAFDPSVSFLLKTFQSFEFSLFVRERDEELFDQRTQRSIPLRSFHSGLSINCIGE